MTLTEEQISTLVKVSPSATVSISKPKKTGWGSVKPCLNSGRLLILELCFQANSTVYLFVTRARSFALTPRLLPLVPFLH